MNVPEFSTLKVMRVSKLFELRIVDPDTVALVSKSPEEDGFDTMYLCLNKESRRVLYGALGIGYKLSKDLYETAPSNWENLIKVSQTAEKYGEVMSDAIIVFDAYESNQGIAYSIIPRDEREISVDELRHKLEETEDIIKKSYRRCTVIHDRSITKVITPTDGSIDLYIMYEFDFAGSSYKMYTAQFLESGIIIPTDKKPVIEVYTLYEFLDSDIKYEINLAVKLFEGGGRRDIQDIQEIIPTAKLSLREILNVISWSKFKVITDDSKFMERFEDIDEESTEFIKEYLNSFGMTFGTLKKLSDTRKSLKYSDVRSVDFSELARFISRCYCKSTDTAYKVDMGIINYMIDCLRQSDAECIKEELGVEVQEN